MKDTINKLEAELKGVFATGDVAPDSLYLSIGGKPVRDYKNVSEGTALSLCTGVGTVEDEVSWKELSEAFEGNERKLPIQDEESGEMLKEAEFYETESGRRYLDFKTGK